MNLREIVQKYRALARGFGQPAALKAFGLRQDETERVFSSYDEDYLISRFFHFTLDPVAAKIPEQTYRINGFPQSHVSLDAKIEQIL
jgi:hypothetical protein